MKHRSVLLFCFVFLFGISCANRNPGMQQTGFQEPEKRVLVKGKEFSQSDFQLLAKEIQAEKALVIELENCRFKSDFQFNPLPGYYASFAHNLIFRSCTFEGNVTGEMLQFQGQISFGKCLFKKPVSFRNSTFFAPAGFRECTFDGDGQFQHCQFWRESTWMGSHFFGIPLMQACRFDEVAQFTNVVFHGNADFSLCRFESGASFDFARAEGNLDLTEARQNGLMTFRKAELLKQTRFEQFQGNGRLRFFETRIEDSLKMKGARFPFFKPEFSGTSGKISPPSFP